MTNMTNDSVIFRERVFLKIPRINSYLYIIYILYINMSKIAVKSEIALYRKSCCHLSRLSLFVTNWQRGCLAIPKNMSNFATRKFNNNNNEQ